MIDGFQHFAAHLSGQSGQMIFLTYRDLEIVLFFGGMGSIVSQRFEPGAAGWEARGLPLVC